ncbi:hypothetical protein D3C76_1308270 [compost metagenome]
MQQFAVADVRARLTSTKEITHLIKPVFMTSELILIPFRHKPEGFDKDQPRLIAISAHGRGVTKLSARLNQGVRGGLVVTNVTSTFEHEAEVQQAG